MSKPDSHSRAEIPEHLMLSRLAQSEQMREFFIQMWIQNPALAKQGGSKVQNLLSPLAAANAEETGSGTNGTVLRTLRPRSPRIKGEGVVGAHRVLSSRPWDPVPMAPWHDNDVAAGAGLARELRVLTRPLLHIDSIYAIFFRMPQLVIDTDVFVAALLSRNDSSVAREVIRRCLQGRYQPLFGVALFTEYETLLSRAKLFADCQLSHKERETVFSALLKQARWIEIYFAWRPNLQDEGDNHLIELAVAGGAQAIVSRNTRDLKKAELLFPDTKILTPKQCLEVFKCPP